MARLHLAHHQFQLQFQLQSPLEKNPVWFLGVGIATFIGQWLYLYITWHVMPYLWSNSSHATFLNDVKIFAATLDPLLDSIIDRECVPTRNGRPLSRLLILSLASCPSCRDFSAGLEECFSASAVTWCLPTRFLFLANLDPRPKISEAGLSWHCHEYTLRKLVSNLSEDKCRCSWVMPYD